MKGHKVTVYEAVEILAQIGLIHRENCYRYYDNFMRGYGVFLKECKMISENPMETIRQVIVADSRQPKLSDFIYPRNILF